MIRINYALFLLTGCFSNWKAVDVDGDGITPLDGDCWDSSEPPPQIDGALSHSLTASDIYVGAEDVPYDGIDANCDGLDDFDADGDGWVPEQYAGIATYGVNGTGVGQNIGDCWDDPNELQEAQNGFEALTADLVNASATERWYDGIDQDCDGLSDFDQDLDSQDSADYGGGDCNDLDATIFEGAVEVFYDGIDQDCLNDDDCDADGDGYQGALDGIPTDICPTIEDCDDSNASVYPDPSVAEIFYNGIDDDCNPQTGDGDADGDGHWANTYEDIMADAGLEPLNDPNDLVRDCWDDPSEIPFGFEALSGLAQLTAADVSPSASEDRPYDGIDALCDGDMGEFDADLDGFDSLYYPNRDGLVGTDCVDSDSDPYAAYVPNGLIPPEAIFPAGIDTWYDGVDQNCDGLSDYDADEDGHDIASVTQLDGSIGDDCNDLDVSIFPGAAEQSLDGVDQNCDGLESCYTDSDGDGEGSGILILSANLSCQSGGAANNSDDCDDQNAAINSSAVEQPSDNIDQNCDGLEQCYVDSDGDGYGANSLQSSADLSCQSGGFSANSDDCDDSSFDIKPTATEICDGIDNNCSGDEQDAIDILTWYADSDGDSYGDGANAIESCLQPTGYVSNTDDCDDGSAVRWSGATETCDGIDNNCSGDEQDAVDILTWYADNDGDLYGDGNNSTEACFQPASYVSNTDDCDDSSAVRWSGATETCDGIDNNCSGDEQDAIDISTWYADSDGDSYGDGNNATEACFQPAGYVSNTDDCDDGSAVRWSGAAETCDGIDNNCSGDEQDAVDILTWYADNDGDLYGDGGSTTEACFQPTGYVSNTNDCDDGSAVRWSGATETCDGIDNNCSGDEQDAIDISTWYADIDGDSYGDVGSTIASCFQPTGYVSNTDDCDDLESTVYIGATEVCDNGIDEDCVPNTCVWTSNGITSQSGYSVLQGTASYSEFARNMAKYDVNSDGIPDFFAVGEAVFNGGQGVVYITSDPMGFTDVNDATQRLRWNTGDNRNSGYTVDIRDVDQDGALEVLTGGLNEGRAYLRSIPYTAIDQGGEVTGTETVFVASGPNFNAFAGDYVQFIGSQDTDSIDDILIGARQFKGGASKKSGGIFLFTASTINSDSDQTLIYGTTGTPQQDALFYAEKENNTNFGMHSTTADLNGDGIDDLIVGEPYTQDCVYIIYGPLSQSSPSTGQFIGDCSDSGPYISPPASVSGGTVSVIKATSGVYFGISLSASGDVDGDGLADLVIGDDRWSDTGGTHGRVSVYSGQISPFYISEADGLDFMTIEGEFSSSRIGRSVAISPDLNGDLGDDLVVSGEYFGADPGAVYIFHDPQNVAYTTADADIVWSGNVSINEGIGKEVFALGDIDGNGLNDLAVSTIGDNDGNGLAAQVYFLFNLTD